MEKNNDSVLHALTFFHTVLQMQETWMGHQQQNMHLLASKPLEFFEQIFSINAATSTFNYSRSHYLLTSTCLPIR